MPRRNVEITCVCGNKRIARRDRVNRGEITTCAPCSHRRASDARKKPKEERAMVDAYHVYRANAKRKNNEFSLRREEAVSLFVGECYYCGVKNAMGIDRIDNEKGYTAENSVSCCRVCNYAKRDMKLPDFLSWLGRAYYHTKNKNLLHKKST